MNIDELPRSPRTGLPTLTAEEFVDAIESFLSGLDTIIEQLESEAPDMGAFDDVVNIIVPDPAQPASEAYREKHGEDATEEQEFRKVWRWEPGEQVILKGEYTAADHEAVQNANSPAIKAEQGRKAQRDAEARIGSGHLMILQRMIVDWTFARNGRKVEVTPQAIRRLPARYLTPLLAKCDEISTGMSEEEQDDFLLSSNEPTKESSAKTK